MAIREFTGELDEITSVANEAEFSGVAREFDGELDSPAKEPATQEGKGFGVGNVVRGMGERTAELGGNLAGFAATAGANLEKDYPLGGLVWEEGDILPSYKGGEEYAAWQQSNPDNNILRKLQAGAKAVDFGYEPGTTWEEVKEADGFWSTAAELVPFAFETGLVSVPDMIAAVTNAPAYITSRSEEIAQERARNDGREGAPTADDMAVGATTAAIVAAMEKFGAEKVFSAFIKGGSALSKILKAAVGEGGTEFVQEQIEYAGESAGTEAGFDPNQSLERGLQGMAGGVAAGGAIGTAGAAYSKVTGDTGGEGRSSAGDADSTSSFNANDILGASDIAADILGRAEKLAESLGGRPTNTGDPVQDSVNDLLNEADKPVETADDVAQALDSFSRRVAEQDSPIDADLLARANEQTTDEWTPVGADPEQQAAPVTDRLEAQGVEIQAQIGDMAAPVEESIAKEQKPFDITDRESGSILVKGDKAAIRQRLTDAGVKITGMGSKEGVVFGKGQAQAVRDALGLTAKQTPDKVAPDAAIPDSVLSAFPDMQPAEGGLIPLAQFTSAEQAALTDAGMVESTETSTGNRYQGVDPEKLWAMRQARQNEIAASKSSDIDPAERNRAIENRASTYDRLAQEQDGLGELGDAEKATEYRKKAAEIRSRKTEEVQASEQPDKIASDISTVALTADATQGSEPAPVNADLPGAEAVTEPSTQAAPAHTIEPHGEKSIIAKGDKDAIRFRLAEAGIPKGLWNAKHNGIVLSKKHEAEVGKALLGDRRTHAEKVADEHRAGEERRADTKTRKRLEDMSHEELLAEAEMLRAETRTSKLAGLPNLTAFEEDADLGWAYEGAADMDGMGFYNDVLGHTPTDALIKAVADALKKQSGDEVRFYHRSGDEFAARAKSQNALDAAFKAAQDELNRTPITLTGHVPNGPQVTVEINGLGLTYGIADTYEQADAQATGRKEDRLARGERAPKGTNTGRISVSGEREGDRVRLGSRGESKADTIERLKSGSYQGTKSPANAGVSASETEEKSGVKQKSASDMSTGEIKTEIDAIVDNAASAHNSYLKDNSDLAGELQASLTDYDFMSDSERSRLHELKLALPGAGEEAAAARARIKEKKANERKATAILNAANVTGKDRLDIMAKFRAKEYSLKDLEEAYPAQEQITVKPSQDAAPADTGDEKTFTDQSKIEDFGEKIEGARKDTWQTYTKKMQDAKDEDIASVPFAKSWPEPDYQKMIDEYADPWTVAFIRAARDEVPTKPRADWKLRSWAKQVETLRSLVMSALDRPEFAAKIKEELPNNKALEAWAGRIELYTEIGHELSLKGVTFRKHHYALYEGEKNVDRWTVERPAKASAFSNWPQEMAAGKTHDETLANFKRAVASGEFDKTSAKRQTTFEIYSYREGEKKGKWVIGKKVGKDYVDLETFDTVKEAREYRDANQSKLEDKFAKFKDIPAHRKESNSPRIGADHRNGADVTPEQFHEAFGFRGVQFGNYVEQGKRQQDLNEAYDALMDLAGILGVPAKALSLNGELGLAFGARGNGSAGKGKGAVAAAAHYESGEIVINLTKKSGAGSLAHEWFHSLDNYFSRARKEKGEFVSERAYARGEGVRPEVVEAFQQIVQAINGTKLKQRATILDKANSKEYWSTGREMFARAFESYVIEKLKDQNQSNDYLANIVGEDYWNAAAALGLEKEGSYPYPEAAEIPAIRAAFDNFFSVVETKETDEGVALFALRPQFFSPLQVAIESAPDKVFGKSAQVKLWLQSNTSKLGIKKGELQWSGIIDYLDMRNGEKVSKEEVVAFLSENGVQVRDVELAPDEDYVSPEEIFNADWPDKFGDWLYESNELEIAKAFEDHRHVIWKSLDKTKDDYIAENTDEDGEVDIDEATASFEEDANRLDYEDLYTNDEFSELRDEAWSASKEQYEMQAEAESSDRRQYSDEGFTKYDKYTPPGGIEGSYSEILVTLPGKGKQQFKSSHFDEPNILVHLRTDEVEGVDGKRYLRVIEVQSDWGQEGKKKGFSGGVPSDAEVRQFFGLDENADPSHFRQEMIDHKDYKKLTPRAPFVGDTKAWVSLGIKRAIMHAINSGADGVVFATGQQNADLYNLSKQVDSVWHRKVGDVYHVQVRKDGKTVMQSNSADEAWLEESLGKEVAQKIINEEGEKNGKYLSLSGLDLKVGGEGMLAFYDQIVPSVASEVLKKIGGGKVERIGENKGFSITDAMREQVETKGLPLFSRAITDEDLYRGSSETGLPVAEVEAATAKMALNWGGNAREIYVHQNVSGLPERLARQVAHGDEGEVQGIHDPVTGNIHLIAANLPTKRDVHRILGHEMAGHTAMEEIVDKGEVIKGGWKAVERRIDTMVKAGNKQARELHNEVRARGYDMGNRTTVTKEMLAVAVERHITDGPIGRILTEIRAAIRNLLRKAGINNLMPATDIDAMVIASLRYLKGSENRRTTYPDTLEHPQIGEIAVKVGNGRTGASKFVDQSPEVAAQLEDLVAGAKLVRRDADSATLQNGDTTFHLIKEDGGWVLTDAVNLARAYHGTPYQFDRFSLDAVGTGEGAQAYGWGIYFAGDKQVAEFYRETLSKPQIAINGVPIRFQSDDFANALRNVLRQTKKGVEFSQAIDAEAAALEVSKMPSKVADADRLRTLEDGGVSEVVTGRLYQVDIPDNSELLDWDKSLREQPEDVRDALSRMRPDEDGLYESFDPSRIVYDADMRGSEIYRRIKIAEGGAEAASKYLNSIGIPGLRYLDGTSRNDGEGSHNYVIWDENAVTVEAVNDEMRQAENEPAAANFARKGGDAFKEENDRIREQDRTLWDKSKTFLKRQLSPGGLLPKSVFEAKIARDSQFEVVEFDSQHIIGQLERAVKADYGKAFGSLDEATVSTLNEALTGKVDDAIPERTKTTIVAMRQYIDVLSNKYVDILERQANELVAKANETGSDADVAAAIAKVQLMGTIISNRGRYAHRSYRAFDDPKWPKKVPDKVLNDARDYLVNRHLEKGETKEEAQRLAEVAIHEILKNGTAYDSMEGMIRESKLGAKDLSVLKKRKEIAPEIRALLGEYKDARLNFVKSTTKMGRLIWNETFLERVREAGMGVFLFKGTNRPPQATKQIAGDAAEAYSPLNGLWTFPETEQAFKDALGKEQMANWYRTIVQINGMVKFGKTVLAPTTAMRNWQSAMLFAVANGHFDMRHMSKSLTALREYFTHQGKGEKLRYLRKLKQLGVVYDTPYAGEMMRLLDDSNIENKILSGKGQMAMRETLGYAQKFYQFGDDFWKIIGFENEKRLLMKHAGMTEAQAEEEAAERIRNTYPTYSMVGRGVQSLRRFPLAGTFVSFPAEIIRTTGNMFRYVAKDMKDPKMRPIAMRRAAGLAIASGFAYGLQALSMAWFAVDDDEDEAVRLLAAKWNKNSNLVYQGRDVNGSLRYFDISFLDPYNYFKRPITAMTRNQPWEDKATDVLSELLTPFLGTDITAGAVFEVLANKKEGSGAPVYQEHDMPTEQAKDIADHLRQRLQPGLMANIERTMKAVNGDVTKSGKKYNLTDELVAWGGWRASTIDPKVSLYYRSFEFSDAKSEANKKLNDIMQDPNEVTDKELQSAYSLSVKVRESAYHDMHLIVQAARASGMKDSEIHHTLNQSGISSEDARMIMQGSVPEWRATPESIWRMTERARTLLGKEKAAQIRERAKKLREISRSRSDSRGDQ